MRALVTGAAGFIGSHLIKKLLVKGHEVLAMDRLSESKKSLVSLFAGNSRIRFIKADLANKNDTKDEYFRNIDWVFHLGAVSRTQESLERPLYYHKVNVTGTFNILSASMRMGVKKFFYAGSASVYGVSPEIPTTENAPILLDSPYAVSKFLAEKMVMHYGKIYKLPVISVRMVSVYGPKLYEGGTYGSILTLFMGQKKAGKPFTVVGNGEQRKDLVYVADAVEAILKLIHSPIKNEIFNIGGGRTYSIMEIVEQLGGKISYLPKRPWEGSFKQVDINKIRNFTGWDPKVGLREGIERILA